MTGNIFARAWKRGLVLVCLLAGAGSALAQSHEHGAQAGPHTGPHAGPHPGAVAPASELGTSAAFDAHGTLWAVSKGIDAAGKPGVVLRSSADQGKTWSAPRQVTQENLTARGEERPRIAFGPKGEMFILYTSPLPGSRNPHIGNIRLVRSTDGGKHFTPAVTVHANRDAIVHAFGNLLLDREGRLYVAWIDSRDAAQAKSRQQDYAGSALYYAVSTDGGASFQGDYRIADHSCECCRIALALNAAGQPVAMWRHVFAGNVRDHAVAELNADGRATPPQRASFDDWRVQACPHHGPSLAYAADGARHQVWFNGKEGEGSGALYARTTAQGKLGLPVALGSTQASHPDVALLGKQVAVAWKQFNGDATAILARLSADGGEHWQEQTLAQTRGDSDRPRLIQHPAGIFLLWHTRDEGLRVLPVVKGKP